MWEIQGKVAKQEIVPTIVAEIQTMFAEERAGGRIPPA
jgi:hypothetical protein